MGTSNNKLSQQFHGGEEEKEGYTGFEWQNRLLSIMQKIKPDLKKEAWKNYHLIYNMENIDFDKIYGKTKDIIYKSCSSGSKTNTDKLDKIIENINGGPVGQVGDHRNSKIITVDGENIFYHINSRNDYDRRKMYRKFYNGIEKIQNDTFDTIVVFLKDERKTEKNKKIKKPFFSSFFFK